MLSVEELIPSDATKLKDYGLEEVTSLAAFYGMPSLNVNTAPDMVVNGDALKHQYEGYKVRL